MRTPFFLARSRSISGALALAVVLAPSLAAQQLDVAKADSPSTTYANAPRRAAAPLAWTGGLPIPDARDQHVTFATTGTRGAWLHIVGGHSSGLVFAGAYRARIESDGSLSAWKASGALPSAHAGMALAEGDRHVILAGGRSREGAIVRDVYFSRVWDDGQPGGWKPTTFPLPEPRASTAAVMYRGHVYVLGGDDTAGATSTVYHATMSRADELSPWTTLGALPGARSHHAAFVHDGAIYLVGGTADGKALGDVIRATINADGSLGEWRTVSRLDGTFATHSVVVHEGYVWVIGGENSEDTSDRVLRAALLADGSLGRWEAVDAPLPSARAHVNQTPVVGGRIFSVGGSQDGTAVPDVVVGTFGKP